MSTTNRRKQERKSKISNTRPHNEPKNVAEDEDKMNRLIAKKEGTSSLGISARRSYKNQPENLYRRRQENLQETEQVSDSESDSESDTTYQFESFQPISDTIHQIESFEPKSDTTHQIESFEPKLKPNGFISYRIIALVLLANVTYFALFTPKYTHSNTSNLDNLTHCINNMKENFPRQEKMFWRSIISGINYTVDSQHPTSFIFLYEDAAETTTQKLMIDLSKCVGCILHMCNSSAVNFNKEVLESEKFSKMEDYGSVLSHLKDKLKDNGLMIVENLDTVPEKFALAFHNICDEHAPFVEQSTIFFTMKMDKFKEKRLNDLRYVYHVLKGKWKNIEHDKLEPLLTRISSMLLRVYPEEY